MIPAIVFTDCFNEIMGYINFHYYFKSLNLVKEGRKTLNKYILTNNLHSLSCIPEISNNECAKKNFLKFFGILESRKDAFFCEM